MNLWVIDTVALIGDEIRIGYQPFVSMRVRTHVWGPAEDCGSSRHLAAHLEDLVLKRLHDRTLVHINAGAHDLVRSESSGFEVAVPEHEYRRNMLDILGRLQAHHHVVGVVAATTTQVDDIRHKAIATLRFNEDVIAYNEALIDAAAATRCYINDLYDEMHKCRFDPLSEDGVNLSQPGKEFAGSAVAAYLRQLLGA